MKKIITILLLIAQVIVAYAQNSNQVDTVRMYLLEWDVRRGGGIGVHQIRERFHHYFETNLITNLNVMFCDYDDFVTKLQQSKNIRDYSKVGFLNALVEFQFTDKSKTSVIFDINGNYYYNEIWHKMHNDLYFMLFRYFSNRIIPEKVLKKAKKNYKGGIWLKE